MAAIGVNTPVVPFSNGTQAEYWQATNCLRCAKYAEEQEYGASQDLRAGGCALAMRVDLGFISGEIPAKTALRIGASNFRLAPEGERGYCSMPSTCAEFRATQE
ncbi:hypothetical protein KLP40_14415 [Hymenobacter sp. NST-14]|uniref:hypothetical protein n=1 Tax=Hymenobacter piscis TaxID=2839984 RepID=UPI001C00B573|nr:hypothetical protein [Hymenobacter piscis]MBT9394361.1 hypothetical protein [Hymenobacter piscis]